MAKPRSIGSVVRETDDTLAGWFDSAEQSSGDVVADQARAATRRALFGEGAPFRVGRFTLIERIGAGGMGVVYSAYDAKLDRRVAIKLLHAQSDDAAAPIRLQREARLLARITHPNVVAVHDVGIHDGAVFIAMEFIEGATMTDWLHAEPRGWRAVLRAYIDAGRGLAAAHAAGLVHRDFKPTNVLIDGSGRARVLDFGLARADAASELEGPTDPAETDGDRISITQTGAAVGTPAYMSPEQHRRGLVDARSDQFAFCVALWLGLYGRHPFDALTFAEMRARVLDGQRDDPDRKDVPRRVRPIVARGLSTDPSDRYPSMTALLGDLERATRTAPVARIAGAVALVGVAVGASVVAGRDAPRCGGAADRLQGVWDPSRKAEVRTAFENTNVPMASAAFESISADLDEYAAKWAAAHREACEAGATGADESDTMLDRSMLCLDRRRARIGATVDQLVDATDETVIHAAKLVLSLAPVEHCRDRERLLAAVEPPPEDLRAEVEAVRAEVDKGAAMRGAGAPDAALSHMRQVATRAASVGYAPVDAEAGLELARALIGKSMYADAIPVAEGAYWTAVDAGDDEIARQAALWRGHAATRSDANFTEALAWFRQAEATARRAGQDAEAMASVDHLRAMTYEDAAKYGPALEHCERALEALPADRIARVAVLGTCARASVGAAKFSEAREFLDGALQAAKTHYGEDHPAYGKALVNLTTLEYRQGRLPEATDLIERAIANFESTLGPDAYQLGVALNNAGVFAEEQGEPERAVELYQRGLAIDRKVLGEEHPEVGSHLNNLGGAQFRLGHHAEAAVTHQRALEIFTKTLAPDHPRVAEPLLALAIVARERERWDEALEHDRRALEIWEKAHGADHPHLAYPLLGLCQSLRGKSDAAAAIAPCTRALQLREQHDVGTFALGQARFWLGQALWDLGTDKARAKDLLADGRKGIATGDPAALEAADAWLRTNVE